MAIYTTLFVASDEELSAFFPGWRMPRNSPIESKKNSPFTGETIAFEDWDSGRDAMVAFGPTLFDSHGREVIAPVLPPDDEYQSWLEANAPALLRTLPHSAMKGVSGFELDALAESLLGKPTPPSRFVDCDEEEGLIGALPALAVQPLAEITDVEFRNVAKAWQKTLQDEGDSRDLEWALRRLQLLAAEGLRRNGQLFSHVLV